MNQDQLRDQVINALVEARVAGVDGSIIDSQAHEVAAVIAPLLAERRAAEQRLIGELADTRGRLGEAQGNHWAARERLDAVEASRRDWATEALRLQNELEGVVSELHERAAQRAQAGGDGDRPQCDGDCGNDDCHMTSSVAAWQMAAAAVQRRLSQADDVNGWSLPGCSVHPDGGDRG